VDLSFAAAVEEGGEAFVGLPELDDASKAATFFFDDVFSTPAILAVALVLLAFTDLASGIWRRSLTSRRTLRV